MDEMFTNELIVKYKVATCHYIYIYIYIVVDSCYYTPMVFYLKCKFVFSLLTEFRYIRMYLEYAYMLIIFFSKFPRLTDTVSSFIRTKVNDLNFYCTNINFISSQCIYAISPCLPLPFLNFMTHTQYFIFTPFSFLLSSLF